MTVGPVAGPSAGPSTPAAGWADRYLALLGVGRAAPSLAALERLVRAHLRMVPFENVTSILRRHACPGAGPVPAIDRDEVLRTWEARAGGGVCFEVTEMFSTLLTRLGYRAHPAIGTILTNGAAAWRGGHQATVVTLDGERYLVDPGNGAPFYEPVPLDRAFEVHRHGLSYRFSPDGADDCLQERLIDGAWAPFCRYHVQRPDAAERAAAYQRHHQLDQSWVASSLFMIRVADDATHVVRGGTWTRYTDRGKEVVPVTSDDEYVRLASEVFGLPALPIRQALRVLAERASG